MAKRKEKTLYRGTHAIGGVCSGIADYFNIDAIIIRIAWILLSFFSLGVAVVLYGILWIVLPDQPEMKKQSVVDVNPVSVQSDKYQNVVYSNPNQSGNTQKYGVYAGIGHIPPKPPCSYEEEQFFSESYRAASRASSCQSQSLPLVKTEQDTSSKKLALFLGLALALFFTGIARLLTLILPGVHASDFFPLIFVVLGIVIIAVPAKRWSFAMRMCGFFSCVELCVLLLPFSVGIVPLDAAGRIGTFALVLWAIVAILGILSLVSPSEVLVIFFVLFMMAAIVITFADIGVFERMGALLNTEPPHKKFILTHPMAHL